METPTLEKKTTTPLNIPFPTLPEGHTPFLKITAGACRLKVHPVAAATIPAPPVWLTGTYRDPSAKIPITLRQEGDITCLIIGENILDVFDLISGVPELDLFIAPVAPFALTIEAGASGNEIDLGGLPITRLEISHGAGENKVSFSAPNPVPMTLLKLAVGAGEITATGLVNANFLECHVDAGAAHYNLDFAGPLRHDAFARISSAVSSVDISVPFTTPVRLTYEILLGRPKVDDNFIIQPDGFVNKPAFEGKTPLLKLFCTSAVSNVVVTSK